MYLFQPSEKLTVAVQEQYEYTKRNETFRSSICWDITPSSPLKVNQRHLRIVG
jgi:hypothetical protein